MSANSTLTIPLHLEQVKHLFNEPEFDPFARHHNFVPGIEQVVSALKVGSLRDRAKVLIYLPNEQLAPGLDLALRATIDRYCLLKTEEADREIASARWDGFKSLRYGLIFLVACSFLSFLASEAGDAGLLSRSVSYLASEGLLVIGWVNLWRPVETLLYGWWPHIREKQLYRYIRRSTDLVVGPEP